MNKAITKLDYIQYLCERKLKNLSLENDEYIQQLERELTNIDVQDLQDYVINLIKNKTKIDRHGSLIYYLIGVSDIDPIKNKIPIKVKKQSSFPDIDSDFSMNEREEVVKYFINKYGSDHVAPIGSYGQMKMKMVMRDIARIFDVDLNDTNEVVKNLGEDVDAMTEEEFDVAIAIEPGEDGFRNDLYELRKYLERHPEVREILFKLKGQLRHLTKHPAGVVATPTKIDETIPLMRHKDELITSWVDGITRKDLQSSGFIKFDILGLKTLTIIKEILELIRNRKSYNKNADFDLQSIDRGQITSLLYEEFSSKLPLDGNDIIYERFRNTDTNGIFQFECIAGDSWIGNYRIKELYKDFLRGPVHKIGCVDIKKKRKIRQIVYAMKKQEREVYRVVVDYDNRCIETSILHEYYTPKSWKKLQDLKIGDKILIDTERCRTQYYCPVSQTVMDVLGIKTGCEECIKNGKRICKTQVLKKFRQVKIRYKFVKIKQIDFVGLKEVYDIGFSNKQHRNYVANGFVVHNSNLMKSLLREIKPTTFNDITSTTALGRPGPLDMGMHHEYAQRKNGKKFDFGSPLIEKCLKDSFGILTYQEDVMRLCNIVAGFPLDLTDTVRKNLMKSIRDKDAKDKEAKQRKEIHEKFIRGCVERGLKEQIAESWWQSCVSFARYGFNKCLTGDTVLTRCNGNQHTKRNITIRELYSAYRSDTKVGQKYRRSGYPIIHSMIDGRIKIEKIKDIVYNGRKPVFRITTDNGFSIKATDIHRFLSEFGWKMVKDFNISDLIAITLQEYDDYKRIGYYDMDRTKRYEKGFEVTYAKIVSIELVGIEDVYDVEMYGDEHNFVANGFISHNSHAVAYTVLSYQMMWFKVYYPLEFYVVLLSNSIKEKFVDYFSEIMGKGINIVPANINKSKEGFTIHGEDNSIMFGLGYVIGVGPAIINVITQTQPFDSFIDFWHKTERIKKIGKSAIVALISAHAFDDFGAQNEMLEKYYKVIRQDTKWERDIDYNDRRYEHEQFVEAYSLDWRTKLSDKQKAEVTKLNAKLLTKLVQPKANMKKTIWGIITGIIEKTSKNDNNYFYVMLTDSKFNIVKIRIPCYNKRCKYAFILNQESGKYRKVPVQDVIKMDNILVGDAETSEYMDRIFIDLFDICCVGNVYEKTIEQIEKLAKYDKIAAEEE